MRVWQSMLRRYLVLLGRTWGVNFMIAILIGEEGAGGRAGFRQPCGSSDHLDGWAHGWGWGDLVWPLRRVLALPVREGLNCMRG